MVKEQSRAQAPGVFLPAFPDSGPDGSVALKKGFLFKKSRDRAALSAIKFKSPWKRREFRVHESSKLQYWKDEVLFGEIPSLTGAAIVDKEKSEADDHEFAFEIQTADENLLLYAETREDFKDWTDVLRSVSDGSWQAIKRAIILRDLLQIDAAQTIVIVYDIDALKDALTASRTDVSNLPDIFFVNYLDCIIGKVRAYISIDAEFARVMREHLTGFRVRLTSVPPEEIGGKYYQSRFNDDGEYVLAFNKTQVGVNTFDIADDLTTLLTDGGYPYLLMRGIRMFRAKGDEHLKVIGELVGVTDVTFDLCLAENYESMKVTPGTYTDEQFGALMYETHLQCLLNQIRNFVGRDTGFAAAFRDRFKSKKIVIKPTTDASLIKQNYASSFTPEGDLLIQYKKDMFIINLGYIGMDLPAILS